MKIKKPSTPSAASRQAVIGRETTGRFVDVNKSLTMGFATTAMIDGAKKFSNPHDVSGFKTWGAFDSRTGLTCFSDPLEEQRETNSPKMFVVFRIAGKTQIDPDALTHLSHFTEHELHTLVVPKRTWARRKAHHEFLSPEETDKAVRLGRINELAEKVFGDSSKAHRWLRKPKKRLGGDTPVMYLSSEAGARAVEEMLEQIDHGIIP